MLLEFPAFAAENRIALVIGNGGYNTAPLLTPVNDARLIAGTLERLGFEVIKDTYKEQIAIPSVRLTQGRLRDEKPIEKRFTNSFGMEFVLIEPGTFIMGSPENEVDRYADETQHEVRLSKPFYMQTTEMTQGQWQKLMGNNPSHFKDCGEDCPVENVSWRDAQKFIKSLNEMEHTGKYRLPTEAEWEYACRAGTITVFSFGDDSNELAEYAWYSGNSEKRTHPVGHRKPNPWGLYDMHGNVWEWVEDDWHENSDGAPDDGRAWIDEPRGADRVFRGGSWRSGAQICRAAFRGSIFPDARDVILGFRLARSVDP